SDCHMPTVKSTDAGAVQGLVHSHAFPAANTAVPFANEDTNQFKLSETFLKNSVSVDIFAISPARPKKAGSATEMSSPQLATTFPVGEEAQSETPSAKAQGGTEPPLEISAPLNRVNPTVHRGDTYLVDVV